MGKKLTYSQRAQREREKERDRVNRASDVAQRRADAKRQRERDQQMEKIQKEALLQTQMRNAKNEVDTYEKFINDISNLHLNTKNISCNFFHNEFSKIISFDNTGISKPIEPLTVKDYKFEAKEYIYKKRDFSFVNEVQLNNSKWIVDSSLEQYCTSVKKNKFNYGTWFIYFVFLFPIALLHYMFFKKNYVSKIQFKRIVNFHKEEVIRLSSEKSILNENFTRDENERKLIEPLKFKESEEKRREAEELNYIKMKKQYEIDLNQYKINLSSYNNKVNELTLIHNKNEEFKLKWYNNLSEGKQKEVEEILELLFPLQFILNEEFLDTDPSEVEVGYKILDPKSLELLLIIDKDLSFIPKIGYKLTASGKEVSEYNLTQKFFNDISNSCIASLGLIYIKYVFDFCNSIDSIKVEICIPGTNKKTGELEDEILLQMNAERDTYKKLVYANIQPTEAITNFPYSFKQFGGKSTNINTNINKEDITWATIDDTNISIENYIKTKFRNIYKKG